MIVSPSPALTIYKRSQHLGGHLSLLFLCFEAQGQFYWSLKEISQGGQAVNLHSWWKRTLWSVSVTCSCMAEVGVGFREAWSSPKHQKKYTWVLANIWRKETTKRKSKRKKSGLRKGKSLLQGRNKQCLNEMIYSWLSIHHCKQVESTNCRSKIFRRSSIQKGNQEDAGMTWSERRDTRARGGTTSGWCHHHPGSSHLCLVWPYNTSQACPVQLW